MKKNARIIRILHAFTMISAMQISASAQGWDGPKCRDIVMSGNEYKFASRSIAEMLSKIEATDIDDLKGNTVRSPWEMGLIPNVAARKLGYQFQLKMIHAWARNQRMEAYDKMPIALQAVRAILAGNPKALETLPIANNDLDLLASQPEGDRLDLRSIGGIEEFSFCAYYSPRQALSCYEALDRILQDMAPVQNITARSEIQQVLTEEPYRKPLIGLALDYMNRIESGESIGDRRLDEDLRRVMKNEDRTWKVLAVLAARGANFYKLYGYATRSNFPVIAALGVISSAALYFDQMNEAIGERFSFPRGVKVACDSGKSYHFWMAAYLTRSYGSKWAAYLSSVAYQMRSDTEFRKPERAFIDSWNSIANQKIRIDLAYSATGADYAERLKNGGIYNFDIDETLSILENGSEMPPPISATKAKGIWSSSPISAFLRWNRIFHPEKAMQ